MVEEAAVASFRVNVQSRLVPGRKEESNENPYQVSYSRDTNLKSQECKSELLL
jgi:hypothetical protein